jgi:ribosomal protein L29
MKKKEKTSLHSMNIAEIVKLIAETKAQIEKRTMERYSKQSKNVREVRSLERKLAIAQTIAQEKELAHE